MLAKTDPTAKIAALNRALAEATKECPCDCHIDSVRGFTESPDCEDCQGTGRVARFPGFRLTPCHFCGGDETSPCEDCDDKRYLVRAGGLEDGLAGLTKTEAAVVLDEIVPVVGDEPMPSADAILAEGLRLVIEVAELT